MLEVPDRVRKWKAANPERTKGHERAYRERNRERLLAEKKALRRDNPDKAYEWDRKNPERRKAIKAKHTAQRRTDWTRWAKYIAAQIRARCKSAGYQSGITFQDILDVLPQDRVCPALGIPLVLNTKRHGRDSPSVDKVDPRKGYVRGNIRVISLRANCMKQDATDPDELRRVADYMARALAGSDLNPWNPDTTGSWSHTAA